MNKLLYVCYMDISADGTVGIKNKVKSQISFFQSQNIDVDYIYVEEGNIVYSGGRTVNVKFNGCDSINYFLLNNNLLCNYQYIYIRFARFSGKMIKFMRKAYWNKSKVVLEIPTYPFNQEDWLFVRESILNKKFLISLKTFFRIIVNNFYKYNCKEYINRIVTFSRDDMIWGVKTIKTCNGINVNEIEIAKKRVNKKEIAFICVSSCLAWHGYDRFIEGIRDYYNQGGKENIVLYIVGNGPESVRYTKMVEEYKLKKHIIFCGKLTGEKLNDIYDKSDIALDAMGRHRSGVFYNSSLKGKEYAAKGLPIVSGVETEFDYLTDFEFYYRVPADESPVNLAEVISFYKRTCMSDEARSEIHEYAKKKFSMEASMKPIVEYLTQN